ncbi:MAG: bifunctional tetrahydrofolate synthase/dihydrofolate synthase [Dokdonella sp.]
MSRAPRTLDEWLDYQQRVHPRVIALGLERVGEVWNRLGSRRPAPVAITVGGTNGKGSTVAFLETILRANGLRVGAYTSPHLLRYNERVRTDGDLADDTSLVAAFERIETARGDIALTYFEYGTLAAFELFADAKLDVALLEVGLGGRLDAVNLIDADAAIVTTVDLDHQDWLGNDRDSIGREKAGIFRADRPAIVGDVAPPQGLLDVATSIAADLRIAGREFDWTIAADGWHWQSGSASLRLSLPALVGVCQFANAAAAIAALHALRDRIDWNERAIAHGIATAQAAARLQRVRVGEAGSELVIDVAHNPQAARILADWLRANPASGRTIAVFGALADKDIASIVAALADRFDVWHLASVGDAGPRGLSASALRERAGEALEHVQCSVHDTVEAALVAATRTSTGNDRIVAFGSFHVAAPALAFAQGML